LLPVTDTTWLWPILVAPFIGSFLGVVITRLPHGQSIVAGRSACDHCGHTLSPLELIPVVSWLFLKGKCRACGKTIDPLLPAVEAMATLVAVWAASLFSDPWLLWASAVFGWALLGLACIDARHFILSDELTLPLIPAGLAVALLLLPDRLEANVIGAVAAGAAFWALRIAYQWIRQREGLGMGDVKLAAAAGAWVGWDGIASVVLIAALVGIAAVLLSRLRGTIVSAADRVPFGTHLCIAIWLVWLYGPLTIGIPID
jgi:leader peptidase (prepilin peptidase) / N-methyltransferase